MYVAQPLPDFNTCSSLSFVVSPSLTFIPSFFFALFCSLLHPPVPMSQSPSPSQDNIASFTSIAQVDNPEKNLTRISHRRAGKDSDGTSIRVGSMQPTTDQTHRGLKPRHIQLIGIGGTIGTALYVQIGRGLMRGGPGSLFLAFTLWCVTPVPSHLPAVGTCINGRMHHGDIVSLSCFYLF